MSLSGSSCSLSEFLTGSSVKASGIQKESDCGFLWDEGISVISNKLKPGLHYRQWENPCASPHCPPGHGDRLQVPNHEWDLQLHGKRVDPNKNPMDVALEDVGLVLGLGILGLDGFSKFKDSVTWIFI